MDSSGPVLGSCPSFSSSVFALFVQCASEFALQYFQGVSEVVHVLFGESAWILEYGLVAIGERNHEFLAFLVLRFR